MGQSARRPADRSPQRGFTAFSNARCPSGTRGRELAGIGTAWYAWAKVCGGMGCDGIRSSPGKCTQDPRNAPVGRQQSQLSRGGAAACALFPDSRGLCRALVEGVVLLVRKFRWPHRLVLCCGGHAEGMWSRGIGRVLVRLPDASSIACGRCAAGGTPAEERRVARVLFGSFVSDAGRPDGSRPPHLHPAALGSRCDIC